MTREEIREELIKFFTPPNTTFKGNPILEGNIIGVVDELLRLEGKLGVVIKVDCPECDGDGRIQKFLDRCFSNRCPKCNGYGYVAVEPLIEDGHNDY